MSKELEVPNPFDLMLFHKIRERSSLRLTCRELDEQMAELEKNDQGAYMAMIHLNRRPQILKIMDGILSCYNLYNREGNEAKMKAIRNRAFKDLKTYLEHYASDAMNAGELGMSDYVMVTARAMGTLEAGGIKFRSSYYTVVCIASDLYNEFTFFTEERAQNMKIIEKEATLRLLQHYMDCVVAHVKSDEEMLSEWDQTYAMMRNEVAENALFMETNIDREIIRFFVENGKAATFMMYHQRNRFKTMTSGTFGLARRVDRANLLIREGDPVMVSNNGKTWELSYYRHNRKCGLKTDRSGIVYKSIVPFHLFSPDDMEVNRFMSL